MTESEGQARELMQVMDNTDCVAIAGGDGTLHEVVTGLLRRPDEAWAVKRFPLGVIPIGKRNTVAQRLIPNSADILETRGKKVGEVQLLAESAMAVIREALKPVDVMRVKASARDNPVFSMDGLHLGSLRDIMSSQLEKYWYWGSTLKPVYAMSRHTMFKDWPQLTFPRELKLSYTNPCSGCSRCYQKLVPKEPMAENRGNRRWWSSFTPRTLGAVKQSVNSTPQVDYSKVQNEDCGKWREFETGVDGNLVDLVLANSLVEGKLTVTAIRPQTVTGRELIDEGVSRYRGKTVTNGHSVEAQEVKIRMIHPPSLSADIQLEGETKAETETGALEPEPGTPELWYSIDSEKYEAEDVDITLLPKKVLLYIKS
jgi:acylglycerol kinase